MNSMVTFFRRREKDPGETYRLTIRMPKGSPRAMVLYSRCPVEPSQIHDHDAADKEGCTQILKQLCMLVSSSGGGGLVVWVVVKVGARAFRVDPAPCNGYRPPAELLVLEAGCPAHPLAVGKEAEFGAGAHLLVPVDEEAGEHLRLFVQNLEWLSPDLEALVLHAIRSPSLEVRLARLEEEKGAAPSAPGAPPASAYASRYRRVLGAVRRWSTERLQLGPVMAILLFAALAANALWTRELLAVLAADSPAMAQAPAPPAADPPAAPAPAPGAAPAAPKESTSLPGDAGGDVSSLLQALREKSRSSRAIQALYTSSFRAYADVPPGGPELGRLFSPASRPFLWGLIKLQALKWKQDVDPATLQSPEGILATKKVYRRIAPSLLAQDWAGSDLLAFAACHLGYKTPSSPGLPETGTGKGEDAAFVLVPGADCSAYGLDKGRPGLQALTSFVKSLPEPAP